MSPQHEKVVWWIKRDFRLLDNPALYTACKESVSVLPFYSYEPLLLTGPDWGKFHTLAVYQSLQSLRNNIQSYGGDILVQKKEIISCLEEIRTIYPFTCMYSHEETGLNHTFARDKEVAQWCKKHGIEWIEFPTNGIVRGHTNRDTWSKVSNQQIHSNPLGLPELSRVLSAQNSNLSFPVSPTKEELRIENMSPCLLTLGEREAHENLKEFIENRSKHYRGNMSSMNTAPTHCSRLSGYLAWGILSIRQVMHAASKQTYALKQKEKTSYWRSSLSAFRSRLYWHSHFIQKFENEVEMEFAPQNKAYHNTLPYVEGDELENRLEAWKKGVTGFPYIDACIRYYQKYGWVTFRSRALLTSFACHGLRIPWSVFQYELAQYMMDYVPGIHIPQTQMQAGVTGTNTIRVYSPSKQMIDQDPEAQFIRENVAELSSFSKEEIYNFQQEVLGEYPKPIINFKAESTIMKEALYSIKKSDFGRKEGKKVYIKHGSRK